ncbi:uncharacterized protein LOC124372251 [Homalodisca vitripennis]|uniref:uncharacterized protein LOC124372251 n=1 Tax=Homalodisca vitripennis TaxID=197043 RepID=UPI001EEB205D|nr:uncharacterized protein LOC124372251 [Homalodisca vitripennis]
MVNLDHLRQRKRKEGQGTPVLAGPMPFGKSSKNIRSPPQGAFSGAQSARSSTSEEKDTLMEIAESTFNKDGTLLNENLHRKDNRESTNVTEQPKSLARAVPNLESLRQLADTANTEEEQGLKAIEEVLKEFEAVMKTNHRVPTVIKSGVARIRESLYGIHTSRKQRSEAVTSERELVGATTSPVEMRSGERKRAMPDEVARLEVNLPPLTISNPVGSGTPARASPEPVTPHLKKGPSNAERVHSEEQLWQEDRQNRKKRLRKEKQAAKTVKKNSEAVQKQAAPAASSATAKLRKEERRKTRPDAVLIRPTTGKSYADLLKDIRSKIKPEDSGAEVRAIRPTRTGGLLVELGSKTTDKDGFSSALKTAIGESGTVSVLEPRASIEIRDLDSFSTGEEVQEAVERELGASAGVVKVFLTQPNRREQKLAVVSLSEWGVNQLLRTSKIKIGWVNCRIRRRVEVTRCFRCFGYGHLQTDCKGPDRKALNLCLKCGESGHKRDTCAAKAKCFLCANEDQDTVDTKHTPGSRTCLTLFWKKQIDLLILSEHYRDRVGPNWFPDYLGTTAIWVPNTNVLVKGHGRNRGIVWVNASDAIFVSCYFSPNVNIADFQNQLDDLEDIILTLGNSRIILAGDFNAKSVEWGMPATDVRGFRILEMAARTGLVVSNVGSAPTFRRPGYRQTIPDSLFRRRDSQEESRIGG